MRAGGVGKRKGARERTGRRSQEGVNWRLAVLFIPVNDALLFGPTMPKHSFAAIMLLM